MTKVCDLCGPCDDELLVDVHLVARLCTRDDIIIVVDIIVIIVVVCVEIECGEDTEIIKSRSYTRIKSLTITITVITQIIWQSLQNLRIRTF